MTLKYTFETNRNPDYDTKRIKSLSKVVKQLEDAKTGIGFAEAKDNNYLGKAKTTIDINLKNARSELKELQSEPKTIKEIHIVSTKKWFMYPEEIGDECGRTKYGVKKEYQVDVKLKYDKAIKEGIKEAIKRAKDSALEELRDYRMTSREIASVEKTFHVVGLPSSPKYKVFVGSGNGGQARADVYRDALRGTEVHNELPDSKDNYFIHLTPGTFVELNNAKKVKKVFERKKPLTSAHHVGVEIEYISKLDKFQQAQRFFNENVQDYVYLTDDGSIRTEDGFKHSHEVTICAPEAIIHEVIARVLRAINKDDMGKVGGRCGLHVHIDIRNRDKKIVFHNLSKAQRIMYAMNPLYRSNAINEEGERDTNFCKKIEYSDFDSAVTYLASARDARYHGVNLLAIEKHSTIEVRLHSGSTNFRKISNWIKILVSIASMEVKVEVEAAKPETFCEYYKLDTELLGYIQERVALFKDKNGKHTNVKEVA